VQRFGSDNTETFDAFAELAIDSDLKRLIDETFRQQELLERLAVAK
jgi:hypothetical protein